MWNAISQQMCRKSVMRDDRCDVIVAVAGDDDDDDDDNNNNNWVRVRVLPQECSQTTASQSYE